MRKTLENFYYGNLRPSDQQMTVNSKLQVRLLEGTEVKARPSQAIKELRTEIHHIGNNINQIARSVNLGIARAEDAKRGLFLLAPARKGGTGYENQL